MVDDLANEIARSISVLIDEAEESIEEMGAAVANALSEVTVLVDWDIPEAHEFCQAVSGTLQGVIDALEEDMA